MLGFAARRPAGPAHNCMVNSGAGSGEAAGREDEGFHLHQSFLDRQNLCVELESEVRFETSAEAKQVQLHIHAHMLPQRKGWISAIFTFDVLCKGFQVTRSSSCPSSQTSLRVML